RAHMVPVMALCGGILQAELIKRASLDDHTLYELQKLGHPYRQAKGETFASAKQEKHEKGFIGPLRSKWRAGIYKAARVVREGTLGHDIKLIHRQEGGLLAGIY